MIMRTRSSRKSRQYSDLARLGDGLLCLPSIRVRSAVRVTILIRQVRQHFIEYTRVHGGSCLLGDSKGKPSREDDMNVFRSPANRGR